MRISDWSSDVCSSDLPFRLPAMERMSGTASVPSYLIDSADQREGGIDVALSATIWTEKMRAAGEPPAPLLKTGSSLPCQRMRSEEHTSELQSLMRISYAVFCLKKKTTNTPC